MRRALLLSAPLFVLAAASAALALPTGPSISASSSSGAGATFTGTPTSLTINQTANRVVIDWRNFNIAKGETVTFSQPGAGAIAFNRIASASTIDGQVTANGGVWLFSPNGLLFGPSASVNVGSLVASTATLADDQLSSAVRGVFVDLTAGAPGATLTVSPGATLNTSSGDLLLFGASVQQGGSVAAQGQVTYAAGQAGSLSFANSSGGGDIALSGYAGPAGGAVRFDHTGATKAAAGVQVTAQRTTAAAGRSVINLDGVLEAQGAGVLIDDGGSAGAGTLVLTAAPSTIKAKGSLDIIADTATLGSVTANDLNLAATGSVTTAAAISTAADASIVSSSGSVSVQGSISAKGELNIYSATDLSVTGGITAGGSASLYGQRDVSVGAIALRSGADGIAVVAGRNLTADPQSLIASSGGSVIAVAGASEAGDATLGSLSGSFILASATGANGVGGALSVEGSVTSSGDVLLQSGGVGQAGHAGVALDGSLAASGGFEIDSTGLATLNGAAAAQTIAVNAATDIHLTGAGAARARGSVALTAGGTLTADAGSVISGSGTPSSTSDFVTAVTDTPTVRLDAAAYKLRGGVSAGSGDLLIQLESGGTIGDRSGVPSLLDNASFATLSAGRVYLLGSAGSAIMFGNLTLDASKVGSLWVGVDPATALSVVGAISGVNGAPGLTLGLVRNTGGATQSMVPKQLLVTGSLLNLGDLRLAATGDILIGTAAFVAAAGADSAFTPEKQSNDYASGLIPGQTLIQAGTLQFASGARVLQQNTGLGSGFSGLLIGQPAASTPLFVTLASTGIGAPSRIGLFGSFAGSSSSGTDVAGAGYLLASNIPASSAYLINGCAFGQAASCAPPTTVVSTPPPPAVIVGVTPPPPAPPPPPPPPVGDEETPQAQAAAATTSSAATNAASAAAPPANFFFAPRLTRKKDDPNGILAPSAGRGNEELWSPGGRAP